MPGMFAPERKTPMGTMDGAVAQGDQAERGPYPRPAAANR